VMMMIIVYNDAYEVVILMVMTIIVKFTFARA
jgi:hypothetical protein